MCASLHLPLHERKTDPFTKTAQNAQLLAAGMNERSNQLPQWWLIRDQRDGRIATWLSEERRIPSMTPNIIWCGAPKYRRDVLRGDVQQRVKELFDDIAIQFDIVIEEMEVSADHVHILCSFPPRYSIAQVVGVEDT